MSVAAIDVRKAVAYAVLDSAGDGVGVRKAVAYAVLDGAAGVNVRKAIAYAVLDSAVPDVGRKPWRLGMWIGAR